MTNFATKIVSVWPPLRKRFIPTFRFFVRKVGYFKKVGNMTQEYFVNRCREKYGDDFDYTMVKFSGLNNKIKIRCNKCGSIFDVRADHFLYEKAKGCCTFCRTKKLHDIFSLSKDDFVKRAKSIHGDAYDYSKTKYTNMHKPIIVTCKKHGDFEISPQEHLKGRKCPMCAVENGRKTSFTINERKEKFIEKAKEIHKGKNYDYSLVEYVDAKTKVEIVCPIHGSFFQSPTVHLQGHGCYMCKRSIGEEKVEQILKKLGIAFVKQYKVANETIFCVNKYLYVDFNIPSMNCFIEYNGQQHYRTTGYFGGDKKLKDTQERDMALRQYCKEHGIKLIEIPYWDYDNIEKILKKELNII